MLNCHYAGFRRDRNGITMAAPSTTERNIMTQTRTLHGTRLSGHTHRVQLFLHLLDLPYTYADSPAAMRATPAIRALNTHGPNTHQQEENIVMADNN